jgi:hypothetical protein
MREKVGALVWDDYALSKDTTYARYDHPAHYIYGGRVMQEAVRIAQHIVCQGN